MGFPQVLLHTISCIINMLGKCSLVNCSHERSAAIGDKGALNSSTVATICGSYANNSQESTLLKYYIQ